MWMEEIDMAKHKSLNSTIFYFAKINTEKQL